MSAYLNPWLQIKRIKSDFQYFFLNFFALNKFWGFLIKNKRHGGCFSIYKNKPPCMKIFKKAIR